MKKVEDTILVKDFKKGKVKTENISRIPVYNEYFTKLPIHEQLILTRNCSEALNKKFGRFNTIYEGLEGKYMIWILNFSGITFYIYTGTKGTNIEFTGKSDNDKLVNFLDELMNIICEE